MRACLDARAHAGIADHPDRHTLEKSARYVLSALVVALDLGCYAHRHAERREIEEERWHERLEQTLARLRAAGIQTPANLETAWKNYRHERDEWEPALQRFAAHLGYEWKELTGDRDLAHAASEEQES